MQPAWCLGLPRGAARYPVTSSVCAQSLVSSIRKQLLSKTSVYFKPDPKGVIHWFSNQGRALRTSSSTQGTQAAGPCGGAPGLEQQDSRRPASCDSACPVFSPQQMQRVAENLKEDWREGGKEAAP